MSTYRLSEAYCNRAPLRNVIFSGVLMALAVPIACGIVWYNMIRNGTDVQIVLISSACVLPLLLLAGAGGVARSYFRARDALRGFELILDRDELTRVSPGLADLTLFREEVTDVVETQGVGLVVRAADHQRLIFVPVGLVGYEEFRGRMAEWAELRTAPATNKVVISWRPLPPTNQAIELRTAPVRNYLLWIVLFGLAAAVMTAFALCFIIRNPYVVVPCGTLLIGVLLWSLWSIVRSPHVPLRTKLMSLIMLFPILSIAMAMAVACGLFPQP